MTPMYCHSPHLMQLWSFLPLLFCHCCWQNVKLPEFALKNRPSKNHPSATVSWQHHATTFNSRLLCSLWHKYHHYWANLSQSRQWCYLERKTNLSFGPVWLPFSFHSICIERRKMLGKQQQPSETSVSVVCVYPKNVQLILFLTWEGMHINNPFTTRAY